MAYGLDTLLLNMKNEKMNLPTKITFSRIIIASFLLILIFIIYLLDEFSVININDYSIILNDKGASINQFNIWIFIIFIFASMTDFLDGYIARKYKMVTDLGKFLDPIADKMLINGLMIFLSFNFTSLSDDLTFPFFCVILMTIRDLIVDGLRFMAASKNVIISANIFGKLKTVLQMIAISFVLLNGWPFSYFDSDWLKYLHITDFICYFATIISLISGIIYLIQNKRVFGGNRNE